MIWWTESLNRHHFAAKRILHFTKNFCTKKSDPKNLGREVWLGQNVIGTQCRFKCAKCEFMNCNKFEIFLNLGIDKTNISYLYFLTCYNLKVFKQKFEIFWKHHHFMWWKSSYFSGRKVMFSWKRGQKYTNASDDGLSSNLLLF